MALRTPARARRGQGGQVLVMFALVQVVLIALAGLAVDYGAMLAEKTRLQNAVDASSLAGARALVDGTSPGLTAARAAATSYLAQHGYPAGAGTTVSLSFPATPGTGALETVVLQVDHTTPTYFARVLGVNSSVVRGVATAKADQRMVDVMLSLDLTGSMELSGTNDLDQLRRAVVQFLNDVNPTNNPRGPKVGMARFAGVMCRWNRTANPGDQMIDIGPGPSEYQGPCDDDKTVLTNLTQDKATLVKIADGSGAGSCPGGISQFACPLVSWKYDRVLTTTGQLATPAGLRLNGSVVMSPAPHYTGTKLPNGITVVSGGGYYAWSTANGGRNNELGEGNARKVLVVMTDGFNELWPSSGHPVGSALPWNDEVVTLANQLKLGPDGVAGTADDVEIYTVGFFCTPYGAQRWCDSTLAATAAPHPCPGAAMPASATDTDVMLRDVSSSAPGTCDHYFPVRKTESLPQLFSKIAGAITRARLTQ